MRTFLLLQRKAMINLDSILKSRDITLPTKVHLLKAMVSAVVMYGCESLTINKSECQRIDAFELWCQRRLLRVTWTARRSNQGNQLWILIGRIDAEVETPVFWSSDANSWFIGRTGAEELTHLKTPWCWEKLKAGGKGDDRGWDGWMASPTRWTWVWVNSGSWWWTGKPSMLQSMGLQKSATTEHWTDKTKNEHRVDEKQ